MARPRKTDPQQRNWPRIRAVVGRRGFSTYQVDSLCDLPKRIKKNFKTLAEAEAYAEKMRRDRNNNGLSAFALTPPQIEDARKALGLIREGGIGSLVDAVKIALSHHRPEGGDVDLAELRARFILAKERKGRRAQTLSDLSNRTNVFVQSFKREEVGADGRLREVYPLAKDVTPAMVQGFFDARGFTTKNAQTATNFRRVLHNFFGFALKKCLVGANPVVGVDIPEAESQVPEILSLEQCRRLFDVAQSQFPDFIPFLALGLFCGLRPDSEIGRLAWEDVQMDRQRVHIAKHKTKVALARNVTIPPNALEWLMLTTNRTGAILPAGFWTRWNRLRWHAGFRTSHTPTRAELALTELGGPYAGRTLVEWPADGMRHTFATNHLAHHRNSALTSAEMGHTRAQTMVFYSGLEPRTEPAAFWELRPALEAGNVISIGAVG
jgi:integrase